jgi:hypothetical protein
MTLNRKMWIALASVLALSSCSQKPASVAAGPDLILHGGSILTMVGDAPTYAEAVAIKDGKIVAVGDDADVFKGK